MKMDKIGILFIYAVIFAAVLIVLMSFLQDYWFVFGLVGGSLLLGALWMLIQKLGGIEKKLDKLLEEKKEE
ncbi:hypothetical protein D1641_17830 [Colidextribacter sp. OB.20]|uniref:hypothetical protein n=1 Tax=Colidextribacter sp. OB.20 TaxID=2304568 RepID=UPI001371FE55|nr:hypothetical protein [Colidextribacter sp. OB.20]NBI11829.1 hypothetical protein [Colidextribacter sp. OB.20]